MRQEKEEEEESKDGGGEGAQGVGEEPEEEYRARGQLRCKVCTFIGSAPQRRRHMVAKHGWLGEVSGLAFDNKCAICGAVMSGVRSIQNHYESYVKTGSCKGIGHNRPVEPKVKTVKEWKCQHCQAWVQGGENGRKHAKTHLEYLRSKAWQRGNEEVLGLREGFFLDGSLRHKMESLQKMGFQRLFGSTKGENCEEEIPRPAGSQKPRKKKKGQEDEVGGEGEGLMRWFGQRQEESGQGGASGCRRPLRTDPRSSRRWQRE